MSAVIVNPPHGYFRPAHLERVVDAMRRLGPPVLRASWDAVGGIWHAREGTHRLRAAKRLGLAPVLVPVPWKRTAAGRARARCAAARHAHVFEGVQVSGSGQNRWSKLTSSERARRVRAMPDAAPAPAPPTSHDPQPAAPLSPELEREAKRLRELDAEIARLQTELQEGAKALLEKAGESLPWADRMLLNVHAEDEPPPAVPAKTLLVERFLMGERATFEPPRWGRKKSPGMFVAVRPCGKEHEGKTFLGVYLGDAATSASVRYSAAGGILEVSLAGHNPALWVPALRRVVFGYESWWQPLKRAEALRQISDADIQKLPYVRALKALMGEAPEDKAEEEEAPAKKEEEEGS